MSLAFSFNLCNNLFHLLLSTQEWVKFPRICQQKAEHQGHHYLTAWVCRDLGTFNRDIVKESRVVGNLNNRQSQWAQRLVVESWQELWSTGTETGEVKSSRAALSVLKAIPGNIWSWTTGEEGVLRQQKNSERWTGHLFLHYGNCCSVTGRSGWKPPFHLPGEEGKLW